MHINAVQDAKKKKKRDASLRARRERQEAGMFTQAEYDGRGGVVDIIGSLLRGGTGAEQAAAGPVLAEGLAAVTAVQSTGLRSVNAARRVKVRHESSEGE